MFSFTYQYVDCQPPYMLTNIKITDMNKYIKKALDKISSISKPKQKDIGWGSVYKDTHWGMKNK